MDPDIQATHRWCTGRIWIPDDGPSNWHIYGVEWTADAMIFTIDGREIYRATRPGVEQYGEWAFDNEKYLILNLALGGNYPRGVNKTTSPIRAFRPGRSILLSRTKPSSSLIGSASSSP